MSCTKLSQNDELNIIDDYTKNNMGIYSLCKKYKIGKIKVKYVLKKYHISLNARGKQPLNEHYMISDWKNIKYLPVDGYHYIVFDKNNSFTSRDINNKGGSLTAYIEKQYGEHETLYKRRKYYMVTGNYWWEQWLSVKIVPNTETKKCPYCGWETIDVENHSGMFETHLKNTHGVSLIQYLKEYPYEEEYFHKYMINKKREEKLKIEDNYVICPLCGEKFERLSTSHMMSKHSITLSEFKQLYPNYKILSKNILENTKKVLSKTNLVISKNRFISSYEKELQAFLTSNSISFMPNRKILDGKEIDLLIEDKKIGIEFDGLRYHTEIFGKKPNTYHVMKTELCRKYGYSLIHIFEDEYIRHKDIILSKLSYILGINNKLPRISARKCNVAEISYIDAEKFLNYYNLYGFAAADKYIGAYYNNKLICVMAFRNMDADDWEMLRFSTDYHYICQGVISKCFMFFIRKMFPAKIVSFADRKWTGTLYKNIYDILGFKIISVTPPDYTYYNSNYDKYRRLKKTIFNNNDYCMVTALGYDKIWDCGQYKYMWNN